MRPAHLVAAELHVTVLAASNGKASGADRENNPRSLVRDEGALLLGCLVRDLGAVTVFLRRFELFVVTSAQRR